MNYFRIGFVCMLLSLIGFSLAYSGGAGQKLNLKGYSVQTFWDERAGQLEVSGRVSGGQSCKSLKLEFFLVGDKGNRGHILTVVDDVGGTGSRMFSGSDTVRGENKDWRITSAYASCVSGERIGEVNNSERIKSPQVKNKNVRTKTSPTYRRSTKTTKKTYEPAPKTKKMKIYEDDQGVLHIEQ